MLTTLRIKNFALVADLTLELEPGYNAITGETGAGKSILIGALNLLLGERADRTSIRAGADSCSVEAVFDISKLRLPLGPFLSENGLEPCEDELLVLKRTLAASGANRQFINGSPSTRAVLASLGEWLVDIHGPHDHQSLLHPSRQLAILDSFGGLTQARERFAQLVRRRSELEAQKAALIIDDRTYAQQLDLLRFQYNEIQAARLQPDEEPQLERDYQRAHNSARLLQLTQSALGQLSEDDPSVLTLLEALGRTLRELGRLDSVAPLLDLHEQASLTLRELQNQLSDYFDRLEIDPVRLQELEERLNIIQNLKRKYGSSLPEIIQFGQEALGKLNDLESRDTQLNQIHDELRQIQTAIWATGRDLSAHRRKVIPKLAKAVRGQLADLGFKQSSFEISLESLSEDKQPAPSPNQTGLDSVEFQFAPNPGEPPRPLRAIASSGELARVMLALKTVLAAEDEIPVLIFDEVDANIGGETAHAVGRKMRRIARQRQVLCITHLAPVAAAASAHFAVVKQVKAGRTLTEIRPLSGSERVAELSRMLGGQSAAARRHAEALLESSFEDIP